MVAALPNIERVGHAQKLDCHLTKNRIAMNIKLPGSAIRPQRNPPAPNATLTMGCRELGRSAATRGKVLPRLSRWFALIALLSGCQSLRAQDFAVTSPGFFYSINNQSPNPTLTLVRGKTYTFSVATSSIHPFQILSPGTAVGNNTSSGTITYTVATNAPATNAPGYRCSNNHFTGIILAVDPPPPPVINILSLSVSSNLVLRSTGTNGWSVLPEFKTNVIQTNWFALTVQTNKFMNGTNETICGKPAGDTVIIRIRSQQN